MELKIKSTQHKLYRSLNGHSRCKLKFDSTIIKNKLSVARYKTNLYPSWSHIKMETQIELN